MVIHHGTKFQPILKFAVPSSQLSAESSFPAESMEAYGLKREPSEYLVQPAPKKKKLNIMTPQLASALDRTNLSSGKASHVLAAVLDSVGLSVGDYNISWSAIQHNRAKLRKQIVSESKVNLQLSNNLEIHWDGKKLPDPSNDGAEEVVNAKVERLAIVLTCSGSEQLLGIPKLSSSSGGSQANAVLTAIKEWNVADQIKALCFDTTSTNTGENN